MDTLLRRFTIFTLSMTIFALLFASLVDTTSQTPRRFHAGTAAPCFHPASNGCVSAL
ncbi:MAG: hypothetical protein ACOH2J_02400 [Allorhizobium sp.]